MSATFGISPALVTPFDSNGVDIDRLLTHTQDCLARGCGSATVFGTTGEGPSVGAIERDQATDRLVAGGLPAERLVEGVIASSIDEAVFSTRQALRRGARAVLLAPPFYFRPVPDDAVFAWYEAVFKAVGPGLRDVILYHIPSMTGVPLSQAVIRRLVAAFPGAIRGVKDSAGNPDATFALIEAFPDLEILVGDETYLGRACAAGAAGSICGLANFAPEAAIALVETGKDNPAVVELVREIISQPIIPMVKALVAHIRKDRAWAQARPPLPTLDDATTARAIALLDALRRPARSAA